MRQFRLERKTKTTQFIGNFISVSHIFLVPLRDKNTWRTKTNLPVVLYSMADQNMTLSREKMSEISFRSMNDLPLEILHRIFDLLDIETLFFSIRPLCRYLRSTVHNYDRLNFNLKIVSKCHFDALCRLISPKNIRSLALYSDEQISLFLSRIRLRQLTKLHWIHLHGIEEFQLNYLFKRINLNHLRSVTIHLTKHDDRRRKTTTNHLSTIVQQCNLRTIEFNIQNSRISQIEWPLNCSIQCLILHEDMNFENLVKIFSCSPQLYRLVVKEKLSSLINSHQLTSSFPQLTSLIIEQINVTIDRIEAFLLLTPSLDYLKLLGTCEIFDGKRWEDFIQINLVHLNRFEFDITCRRSSVQTRQTLNLFVQSYRSRFWIEHKKWFITVECNHRDRYSHRIYSLPMCQCSFEYDSNLRKVSLSTSNEICPTENISQLNLQIDFTSDENVLRPMNFSFPNVRKLHVYFPEELPVDFENYLRKTIDVDQLIEMKFECRSYHEGDEDFLSEFLTLLKRSRNLSSLILHIREDQYEIYPHLETLMQFLPSQINHLQIPILEPKHIGILLEYCPRLSSVRFPAKRLRRSKEIKRWFERNTSGSIYHKSDLYDDIWIGKKNNDDKQENLKYKRIKISKDFMES